ncbi:hypothetical protein G6F37_012510 [Rhizopus arrhizus]|nr:hypothetical protein G6F37_012510 [Rhizopus arrhizus]
MKSNHRWYQFYPQTLRNHYQITGESMILFGTADIKAFWRTIMYPQARIICRIYSNNFLNVVDHYQLFVQNLKKEKYNIIGYVRKSRTNENDESRVRLLQQMTRRLKERSLVDKVFVSLRANANDLMVERDSTKDEDLLKQLNVDGDAQDLHNYINQNEKICLIILGYAGLSTNCKDLEVKYL